jgi:O-antigen/teichoic acid export membrane protein
MAGISLSRHESPKADSSHAAARGTLQLMAAEAGVMLGGYLTVVVLARGLGPHAYGIYGIILSLLVSVELVGRLGIPQALAKLIPENDAQAPRLEQAGLILSLVVSSVIFGLFWFSAPSLAEILQIPEGSALLRLAAIDIPFYGMYFTCDEILGGRRQFGAAALGGLIYAGGKTFGVVLLYWWGLSISGALVVNIIASIIALLFLARHVPVRAIIPERTCMAVILRLALPMALFSVGMQVLLSLDLWALSVLGRELADETMGWYVAALNVARLPTVTSFVMMGVLIPVMSRALSQGDMALARRHVRGAMRFLCVVLVPICVLCALSAESVMALLYSNRYAGGAVFLRILVFGLGLSYTCLITLCAMLIASGLPLTAAGITLALLPLEVLFHSWVIPAHGGIGAAAVATLSMTVGAATAGYIVYRKMGALIAPAVLWKVALATAGITAVGIRVMPPGPTLIIGGLGLLALYALILVLLGELTRGDLRPFLLWRSPTAAVTVSEPSGVAES